MKIPWAQVGKWLAKVIGQAAVEKAVEKVKGKDAGK